MLESEGLIVRILTEMQLNDEITGHISIDILLRPAEIQEVLSQVKAVTKGVVFLHC